MKTRTAALLLALILTVLAAFPAACFGDALAPEDIEIETDYYVVVLADDGGVNFREGPGTDYAKLRDEVIPNGTVLHIDRVTYGDYGISWGRTEYEGKTGWIALTEVVDIDEPIVDPSYPPGPGQHYDDLVFPDEMVSYFAKVTAEDGTAFRYGPGTEYDLVVEEMIPEGEILYAGGESPDSAGELWSFILYDGQMGWVRKTDTEETEYFDPGWEGQGNQGNSEKTKLHKHTDISIVPGRSSVSLIAVIAAAAVIIAIPVVIALIVLLTRRKR